MSTRPKARGDQGADIIGHYEGLCVVFQCKFYTHPVGNSAVQEAVVAREHEQANLAVVISNATYTRWAEELAGTTKTILIHHDNIPALMKIIRSPPFGKPKENEHKCPHCSAINRVPPDKPLKKATCGRCHQPLSNAP